MDSELLTTFQWGLEVQSPVWSYIRSKQTESSMVRKTKVTETQVGPGRVVWCLDDWIEGLESTFDVEIRPLDVK